MNYTFLLIGCAIVMMLSCNNNNTDKSETKNISDQNTIAADTTRAADSADIALPEQPVLDDTISAKSLPAEIRKTISNDSQSVRILLTDATPGLLKIHLSHSNENGNIRISQVMMPDGSSEGPFGRSLDFEIRQKGNHTFVIDKNNMASGSQVGDIVVTIEK